MMIRIMISNSSLVALLLFFLSATTGPSNNNSKGGFFLFVSGQSVCVRTVNDLDYGKYHSDESCDRAAYNVYKRSVGRGMKYRSLKSSGTYHLVPNQKTVICPTQDAITSLHEPGSVNGYDTMWLVENTASTPVVLAWVDPGTGIEYSAWNGKITPPQQDPNSVLQPGEWKSLHTYEGHVFHVRPILDATTGATGPVILQHRAGLIPIGENAQHLHCDAVDPEPIKPATKVREVKFQRQPPRVESRCNQIDVGFRNVANCPLHGYWVLNNAELDLHGYHAANDTTNPVDENNMPAMRHHGVGHCEEHFRFHVGKEMRPSDFMWQWQSPSKFEGTFVGHSFSFRSAHDNSILVDTYTVAPTNVVDCPGMKQKAAIQINTDGLLVSVGKMQGLLSALNLTAAGGANGTAAASTANSAEEEARRRRNRRRNRRRRRRSNDNNAYATAGIISSYY